MQSTDDDLHCIRYSSLLMLAYWQPPILSFSGYGATALEKNGCTHPMKEDVKKKSFSPPLGKTRVW